LLGVLLMPLEDFEAGLQKALEFGIGSRWNQCCLKRAIHSRVVRYLIGSVSLVEIRATDCGKSLLPILGFTPSLFAVTPVKTID
jgi:hypothetical protein